MLYGIFFTTYSDIYKKCHKLFYSVDTITVIRIILDSIVFEINQLHKSLRFWRTRYRACKTLYKVTVGRIWEDLLTLHQEESYSFNFEMTTYFHFV